MERKKYILPYNERNINEYTDIPEFNRPEPDSVISVPVREYRIGTVENQFVSRGFVSCTGVLVQSTDRSVIGLLHLLPLQVYSSQDFDRLSPLRNGNAITVQGSGSVPQNEMLETLHAELGITPRDEDKIFVDTRKEKIIDVSFDLLYRPQTDEILVRRYAHKDLLVYPGFSWNMQK